MKHIIHYCLLLCTGTCFAQDTPVYKETILVTQSGYQTTKKKLAVKSENIEFSPNQYTHHKITLLPSNQVIREINLSWTYHNGTVKTWHANGKQHFSGLIYFLNDSTPELRYIDCWDTEGNQLLKAGNGIYKMWHPNGNQAIAFEVKEGQIAGPVQGWEPNEQAIVVDSAFVQALKTIYEAEWVFAEKEPVPLNLGIVRQMVGYPQLAIDAGIQGDVVVRLLVDENGNYIRHKVIKSAHPLLLQPVEAFVPQLRFTPAILGGKPVRFWVNVPFKFTLIAPQKPKKP